MCDKIGVVCITVTAREDPKTTFCRKLKMISSHQGKLNNG